MILLGVLRIVVQVLQDPCLYGRYMHERLLRVKTSHLAKIRFLVQSTQDEGRILVTYVPMFIGVVSAYGVF